MKVIQLKIHTKWKITHEQNKKPKDGHSKKWEVVFKTETDDKKSWINIPRIPIIEFKHYYYKAIFNYIL